MRTFWDRISRVAGCPICYTKCKSDPISTRCTCRILFYLMGQSSES
ncbi:hypothetical protein M6B38_169905 [Iris pallida]|uniref:Uncharacterized protein n=1 Tax=Iris pallida TaxID=29817 RepID=A0AAX6EVI4_IRIPA|nr:hypothetical protein M6B38_169905 [Iris pallida]